MIIVVMGVSGCGKSTIGAGLAAQLAVPFLEGDAYHSESNVRKMSAGIPLNDADRLPWAAALADAVNASALAVADGQSASAVLACSALTRFVRAALCEGIRQPCRFVHLQGDRGLIRARLEQRTEHFMGAALLDSQYAALEVPEDSLSISVDRPVAEIIQHIAQQLGLEES